MDIDLLFLLGLRLGYIELAHAYKTLNPNGIYYSFYPAMSECQYEEKENIILTYAFAMSYP